MIELALFGKPNAGKSSFFKAATMIDVKISPIPFTTIEPNKGAAFVSTNCVCKEFNVKCNPRNGFCLNGTRFIPILLWDIAGLVKGASEGRGMGNKFLDDVRRAEALIHVVDFSGTTDENGNFTEGYNPENDIINLESEIDKWFIDVVKRNLQKVKDASIEKIHSLLSGLEVDFKIVEYCFKKFGLKDLESFAINLRKISKPIVIAANKMDLESSQANFELLKEKYNLIPTSCEYEIALKLASKNKLINYLPGNSFEIVGNPNEKQKEALDKIKKFIEKFGSTGVQKVLDYTIFNVLNYIVVYPVANENTLTDSENRILPDAFLVKKGSTALDLAYKIHTEIGKAFKGAINVRNGMRIGKDYVLNNNDVIKILT